jgi:hypothetical protein
MKNVEAPHFELFFSSSFDQCSVFSYFKHAELLHMPSKLEGAFEHSVNLSISFSEENFLTSCAIITV